MAQIIEISVQGLDQIEGLDRMANSVDGLGNHVKSLTGSIDNLSSSYGRHNSASSGAASSINRQAAAARAATGPMQRLAKAQLELSNAIKSGDSGRVFDAQYGLSRAQANVRRAQSFMGPKDPMADMLSTSRVAIGPNGQLQIMPLVNRLRAAGMLGSGQLGGILNMASGIGGGGGAAGAAGGAGLAAGLTGAAVALVAFAAVVKVSVDTLKGFSSLYHGTGGSSGQTAVLGRLGASIGISPQQMVGLARGAQSAIFNGEIGTQVARGRIPITNPNYDPSASTVIHAIDLMVNKLSRREAERFGFATGLQDFLILKDASPEVRNKAFDALNQQFSADELRKSADLQIELNLAMHDFQIELTKLGVETLPQVTEGIKVLTFALGPILKLVGIIVGNAMDPAGIKNINKNEINSSNSRNRNTRAVEDNTRAIQAAAGTYGGGNRTRGAVPGAWRWDVMDQALQGQARALGAFNV